MISVIIPTYNEEACLEQTLQQLLALENSSPIEVIVTDGGSTDRTTEIASRYAKVVRSEKGRGRQLNKGAAAANGDILFFVHADMLLPPHALTAIENTIANDGMDGGGFANQFDEHNQKIKQLGRWLNLRLFTVREQSDRLIFYGDNGIFVRRSVFEEMKGFKEIPIMEDYDFSIRMRNAYKVVQINDPRLTLSSRRHIKAGFLKTRFQWIMIKKLYLLGVSPNRLAQWYQDVR